MIQVRNGFWDRAGNELQKTEGWLRSTLKTLDRPLIFAIDGLECDRQSRGRLLTSLKAVSGKTSILKILLSTRPEERILEQLNGMGKIQMECSATRDRLVVEKTAATPLSYLPDQVKVLVMEALSCSARGSGIWTRMIVELIETCAIRALGPMRAFLDEMPQASQLRELYASLYSRYTADDPENQIPATTALEILAVARWPLSMLELGWAVALGAADETVRNVDALAQRVDYQRFMSLIQPFVAHVDFVEVAKHQVKLVHQSVKEFVINFISLASDEPSKPIRAYATLAPPLPAPMRRQRMEQLEAGILAISVRYLLLHEIGENNLLAEERLVLEELPQDPDLFDDDHVPTECGFGELFVYASCHWTEHFRAVSAASLLPSVADIEVLCRAGSTRLHSWIVQNCRPDCATRPRLAFDSSLYGALNITSLYGSEAMLQRVLNESDLDGPGDAFLPRPVMKAADQILQWIEGRWGSALLSKAVRVVCLPMARGRFGAAQHRIRLSTELLDISQSESSLIGTAVCGNHVNVMGYLLVQQGIEAHVLHRNVRGENVLHLASRYCNPAVFRQLVPRLKHDVYQRDAGRHGLDSDYSQQ
ncbi:hypothetical protein B0T26DRAFT_803888 [Lasiosphaeria miniovina]|uniref:Uncharacterized protein n=1 Tax=Lasiosphaeria miniovina TaxID=1954250 RepID=A0AA40ABR9_9PEZI|nr:uncharacterized protein B0T26DRAFT_803888 [Lasiosphaeria miniovina]KAK0712951.1 hypothetical protein B0T26DRAFT_803888 [Lasiosphaeria miniovina]